MRGSPGSRELVVVEKPRAVVAGPDLFSVLPGIDKNFAELDNRYIEDKNAYLGALAATVEEVPDMPGLVISVLADDRVEQPNKLGIIKTPLDGTYPQSTAFAAVSYANNESPSWWQKQRARPHTWNEIGKLATDSEIAIQQGVGMTMVMIYKLPDELFTAEELQQIKSGDTSPMGRIYKAVADYVQEKHHGKDSETQYDELYLYEHGMGFETVGAADWLQTNDPDRRVKGVIIPNMVANVNNRVLLLARYTAKAKFEGPPHFDVLEENFEKEGYKIIPEPLMRQDFEDAELAMRKRQARAMLGVLNSGAMVRSGWLREALERVVENGAAVTAPISVHANIVRDTIDILPHDHPNFWMLPVTAVKKFEGEKQYATLDTNENYGLGAIELVEGVLFADDLDQTRHKDGAKI